MTLYFWVLRIIYYPFIFFVKPGLIRKAREGVYDDSFIYLFFETGFLGITLVVLGRPG